MKMSDVFNLPLRAVEPKDIGTGRGAYPVICADCVGDKPRGVIGHLKFETGPHTGTGRHMDYALAKEMTAHACRAINNHDRLTSENARLREALRKSSNALERLLDVDESDKPNELVNARNQAHFTSMSNEELLTELEKGDE